MNRPKRRLSRRVPTVALLVALTTMVSADAAPKTPTIAITSPALTPYNSGGCVRIPCYKVFGNADAGMKVTVVAADAFGNTVTTTTFSAEYTDPGTGVNAGDYWVSPNLTPLGTHDASPSSITLSAFAEDLSGNKSPMSAPLTIVKHAVTPGDANAPKLQRVKGEYPATVCGVHWCNGNACLFSSVLGGLPGQSPEGGCTGRYKISGEAEDLNETAFGAISEIADVLLTVRNSTDQIVNTVHAVGVRRGTQGFWSADILATDYEVGESYSWSIVAIDASGNVSAPITGTFTRYPL